MTVHLFGAVSSPACSVFALRKTANVNEKEFGPLAAKTIKRNFYVDDCLKSRNDTSSTITPGSTPVVCQRWFPFDEVL